MQVPHTHPGAILAAIYYITDESDKIHALNQTGKKTKTKISRWRSTTGESSDFEGALCFLDPRKVAIKHECVLPNSSLLVYFPGFVIHSVFAALLDKNATRISIAMTFHTKA